MSVMIEEHILKFHITIENTTRVKILEGQKDFSHKELHGFASKPTAMLLQVKEEVTTTQIVHHHVELVGALPGPVHVQQKGVRVAQDVALGEEVAKVTLALQLTLGNHLHGVNLARSLLAHLKHTSEATHAQHAQLLKVTSGHLGLARTQHWECPGGLCSSRKRARTRAALQGGRRCRPVGECVQTRGTGHSRGGRRGTSGAGQLCM
mmetsp:Transcript_12516/g.37924  ORF Transcript_12516/g.37924 Transcript_12516/m.37924 type:complete len:207 (-) Transcript_12516:1463-2083(-)